MSGIEIQSVKLLSAVTSQNVTQLGSGPRCLWLQVSLAFSLRGQRVLYPFIYNSAGPRTDP